MKVLVKQLLISILLMVSFNVFSQEEKTLIIKNHTNQEYLGLYFDDFIPLKDMYITTEGEIKGYYKYKSILIKSDEPYIKENFNRNLTFRIYSKDSVFIEIFNFKLDCQKIDIEMYIDKYQINYHRKNGIYKYEKSYLNKQ